MVIISGVPIFRIFTVLNVTDYNCIIGSEGFRTFLEYQTEKVSNFV